jgi:aldehyde dehydrogenase (NAD+)
LNVLGADTRILTPRRRYDEVVEALAEMVDSLRFGDPADATTEIGLLVSASHRRPVRDYIAIGDAEGANVVGGGNGVSTGQGRGWFVAPTVFAGANNDMCIAREEIFGPVVDMIPYEREEQGLRFITGSLGRSGRRTRRTVRKLPTKCRPA